MDPTKTTLQLTSSFILLSNFLLLSDVHCTPISLPPPHQTNPPYCGIPPPPSSSPPISPPHSAPPTPPQHRPSPPVIYPPPLVSPPPPHKRPQFAVWCVAKPTVPELLLQEALDYACGTEADCKEIQVNGKCFQPDTVVWHASYAFNSYWQKKKGGGGTCDFGGTAMLVTDDPSFDDCIFIYK